jgi:hypothetical protein
MKCNVKNKQPKIQGQDLKLITEEYAKTFDLWLAASGISEEEFLRRGAVKPFKIHTSEKFGTMQIYITCGGVPLGQPFISSSDKKAFMVDTAYMLLYVAGKLDSADGGDYFSGIAREFAKTELM